MPGPVVPWCGGLRDYPARSDGLGASGYRLRPRRGAGTIVPLDPASPRTPGPPESSSGRRPSTRWWRPSSDSRPTPIASFRRHCGSTLWVSTAGIQGQDRSVRRGAVGDACQWARAVRCCENIASSSRTSCSWRTSPRWQRVGWRPMPFASFGSHPGTPWHPRPEALPAAPPADARDLADGLSHLRPVPAAPHRHPPGRDRGYCQGVQRLGALVDRLDVLRPGFRVLASGAALFLGALDRRP